MRNKLRRPLAFLLSAVMIVTMSGTPVHAVADRGQPETGLCEHHAAHTDDCGYTEETPGTPCGHEHTEDCYTEVTECVHEHTPECYPEETEDSVSDNEATPANAEEREPENCPHICDKESGCIAEKLDCQHEHDSECGYTESTPGTPCTYVCEICNPQDSGEADEEPETGIIKQEQCSCLTLCTEGQINPDCPVCGAEDAGLSDCKGKAEKEDTKQPEDTGICKHHQEHDDACGYQPESEDSEGSPCTYECRICPIEDLIAALPDKVTEDNADEVRAQLDEILALFSVLTEDEQEQIDLSRCYELQGALDGANDPAPITESVEYQEASWDSGEVVYADKTATCTPVESSAEAVTWTAGWYAVSGTVTIDQPITVTGAVNLILADGCTLDAQKGIVVETGNSLTIYAQSENGGTLNATGMTDDSGDASAGIGGSTSSVDSGSITIHGGIINATGGGQSGRYGGAGIGGGTSSSGNGGSSRGIVTIYGGTITANSGAGNVAGAGIGGGGGGNGRNGGDGGGITIYGGNVTAASHGTQSGGAGIGGGAGNNGNGGAGNNIQINGGMVHATGGNLGAGIGGGGGSESGDGTVTISGGTVTAVGGNYAAGIGGGGGYQNTYGGCTGGTGSVTITGGIVDASSPTNVYWEGYEGAPIGNGGNATATATVNKTTGIIFENGVGTVCGDVTLAGSYTVPAGYSLHIPAGASLSGSGTLSGGETFTTDLSEDMISVPEDLYYDGTDRTAELQNDLSAELNKGIEICGQTFTVSGWTLAVAKAADSDLTYTATYTNNNDNTNTFTKTITLQKSGTDLTSEGKVQTYKGDTLTKDFTASDTITVKATPTATGEAPAKAAARLRGDPTAGQMAVFVGTTQVSLPADAVDGTYTMSVSAADVLTNGQAGENGKFTLIVKFIGTTNMADAEVPVEVTITRNPLTADMVMLSAESATYNGTEQKPIVTVTGLTVGKDYDVTFQDGFKNAGTYTVTVTGKGIYEGTVKKTFSIGKAALTIKANDQTITYGQSITEGTGQVTATGLCAGDSLSSITLAASTRNVPGGTIELSAAQIKNSSSADMTANYTITYQPGTLTINKAAAPAITWPAANGLTYGQKLSESTLSGGSTEYGSFAWKNPDTVPTAGTSGYSVTFTPSDSTVQNYEPITTITQDVNVTVAQATPTVTVEVKMSDSAKGRVADLLVTVTGAQNGAAPAGSITLTSDGLNETLTLQNGKTTHKWENLSDKEYTVTAAYSGDTNYKAANSKLTFDAAKKNQESFAIFPVEAKTYGDPAFDLASTGGNGSGAVSFTSSDPSVVSINDKTATIRKAGTVTITARKAADNNYNEAVAAISVTIGKRPITLTADSFTVVKGAAMPTLTYQAAGLVNSDTFTTDPTMTTSVSDTNTLGEYAIVISGGILTNGDSYQITYVNGKLTVTDKIPVQLTIAATPDSLTGGGTVTLTISGLPAGGEATVSCSDSSINVTGSGTSWKATLPNETATYTFTANYSGDTQHSSAMATCTVSVTKRTNGGGSSGGGNGNSGGSGNGGGSSSGGGSSNGNNGSSGGGSTIVARPDETKPDTPTTSQTKPATPDKNGNVAVDNGTVQSAINAAKNDAKKNGNTANGVAVVIPVTPKEGQNSFNVTINAQTLNTLVREKVKRLEINIEGVVVGGMDTKLLKWLDTLSANGDVIFRVKKTDPSGLSKEAKAAIGTRPVYDLSLVYLAGGKETPITDFDGHTIAVRLPYAPAKDEKTGNLYAVYVDGKGKVEWLTKSSYDPDLGTVVFETGHFSIYGIGYKNPVPVFTDIKNHWAEDNIIFVASRGLLAGTGNNQFSPDTGMTRGMFVTALGRLAGIDQADYKTGKFTDVKADAYYAPYVNWAAEKGIVNGTSATTFSPDTNITREQMAVIMANYAKKLGYDLPVAHDAVTFVDNAQISGWAAKEVKAMQQAGIMAGKGGNRFDPKGTATRAEVATVLRRFVEIVIDPQTAQGWVQNHSGSWQYMKNGKPATGWLQDDKKWYWLDSNGWMFTGGWKQIDGKWYYFYSDGSMAVNTTIDGYAIGSDGARK